MRIIEIKEKEILEDRIKFIAECNDYDNNGVFISQQSRTKFALFEDEGTLKSELGYETIMGSLSWSDEQIVLSIKEFQYQIYF